MSEQNQPTIESLQAELATLRTTNTDLVRKNHERGERIKTLANELDTTKASLATSQTQIYNMTVGLPVKELAREASSVPALWLGEFNRHFKQR